MRKIHRRRDGRAAFMNPLEVHEFNQALVDFRRAAYDLYKVWNKAYPHTESILYTNYPFDGHFEEILLKIDTWVSSNIIYNNIHEKR